MDIQTNTLNFWWGRTQLWLHGYTNKHTKFLEYYVSNTPTKFLVGTDTDMNAQTKNYSGHTNKHTKSTQKYIRGGAHLKIIFFSTQPPTWNIRVGLSPSLLGGGNPPHNLWTPQVLVKTVKVHRNIVLKLKKMLKPMISLKD